jgi:hypothetical protein
MHNFYDFCYFPIKLMSEEQEDKSFFVIELNGFLYYNQLKADQSGRAV